jgi:chorismate synthase
MNSLGNLFKVTSFGESHGSHVGCLIEGCPAGLQLNVEAIQQQVNRRRTNRHEFTSLRNEEDKVVFLSGLLDGKTLGSPIAIVIENKNAHSNDYDELKNVFRPSHADYTNEVKYGFRDYRGGGRSSIRITAPLVAAGELASQLLRYYCSSVTQAYVSAIGTIKMNVNVEEKFSVAEIDASPVRCPNKVISAQMLDLIQQVMENGDTLGGVIHVQISDLPVGIGEPIFGKLQAQLGHAMLSINTVKGFEFGAGFANATLKGSESNDSFEVKNDHVATTTNKSGGIQGGISNGEMVYFNVAFKPISSILQNQKTISKDLKPTEMTIHGRHDVCAVPRAIPIVEAYTNIILIDLFLQHKLSKL